MATRIYGVKKHAGKEFETFYCLGRLSYGGSSCLYL